MFVLSYQNIGSKLYLALAILCNYSAGYMRLLFTNVFRIFIIILSFVSEGFITTYLLG